MLREAIRQGGQPRSARTYQPTEVAHRLVLKGPLVEERKVEEYVPFEEREVGEDDEYDYVDVLCS